MSINRPRRIFRNSCLRSCPGPLIAAFLIGTAVGVAALVVTLA